MLLNPADPPVLMRNAIYADVPGADHDAVIAAVNQVVETVAGYVPGYRQTAPPKIVDDVLTVLLEVEGAGEYLPEYAGNLDIMTSAAVRLAELSRAAGGRMSARVRLVDTTMRDGSHSVAHQYTPEQVATAAKMLDDAGVWAIAVGHGDGLGAGSRQYGYAAYTDAELLAAAAEVVERAEIAVALLPGIGTKEDLRAARDAGATVVRVSTVITEADIGIQHLEPRPRARDDRPQPPEHGVDRLGRANGRGGEDRRTTPAARPPISSTAAAPFSRTTSAPASRALREEFGDELAIGIHEHNNLSLAVSNSVAAIEEGATIADVTLAGMGAGAGNCQGEALVAVLQRMGIETGADLLRAPGRRRQLRAQAS